MLVLHFCLETLKLRLMARKTKVMVAAALALTLLFLVVVEEILVVRDLSPFGAEAEAAVMLQVLEGYLHSAATAELVYRRLVVLQEHNRAVAAVELAQVLFQEQVLLVKLL